MIRPRTDNGEKSIDANLKARVEKSGGMYVKLGTQFMRGLPDRLVLLPGGKVLFIETKTKGDKPTPVQQYVHGLLLRLGFRIEVADTMDKARSLEL